MLTHYILFFIGHEKLEGMRGIILFEHHRRILSNQPTTITVAIVKQLLNEEHPFFKGKYIDTLDRIVSIKAYGTSKEKAEIDPTNVKKVVHAILTEDNSVYRGEGELWTMSLRQQMADDIATCFTLKDRDNFYRNTKDWARRMWSNLLSSLKPSSKILIDIYKLSGNINSDNSTSESTFKELVWEPKAEPFRTIQSTLSFSFTADSRTSSSTTSSSTNKMPHGRPGKNTEYAKLRSALYMIYHMKKENCYDEKAYRHFKDKLKAAIQDVMEDIRLKEDIINNSYTGALPNTSDIQVRLNNIFAMIKHYKINDSLDVSQRSFEEDYGYEWDTTKEGVHRGDDTMWEGVMGLQTKQETILHVKTRNKKRSRTGEPIQAKK